MIDDPQEVMPGSAMPRPRLDESTRELLARYLATRGKPSSGTATTAPPHTHPGAAPARDGRTLYTVYCAACHGSIGRGDGPNAVNLPVKPAVHASSDAMSRRSDDALFDTIAGGGAIMNRSPRMPAFGGTLSSLEIRSLVRHIRELCKCSGPSWSTDNHRAAPRGGR
jgi:mono/diheme cytochrome c family protein